MHDTGKAAIGLAIFLALATAPIWYNAASGKSAYRPEPVLPKGEKQCVAPKDHMVAHHMDLLDEWRDKVVRGGEKMYVSQDGREFEMSLTRTCMRCHTDRAEFCGRCHEYAGVEKPFCWNCHVDPQGKK